VDKAFDHGREADLILVANGFELQTQAFARLHVPYRGAGAYLSILDEKMEFDRGVDRADLECLDEQATDTHVLDLGSIFEAAATPEDIHSVRRSDALVLSGTKDWFHQGRSPVHT
jgi:hypothetical protein